MRLLSIRLNNVRRFTSPVVVAGLGPGLNVLSAPNETGKSTVFDALHAVFFKRFASQDSEVMSLVPHSKGDPEVEVEFEHDGATLRLAKVWSRSAARRSARLYENGRLVAQADAAEARIAGIVQAPKDGGPAGLLWVRQGLTGLETDKAARDARRGLLASVAGEVEAMTGGRQMETALDAVAADLARYLTATGKPRAGGPLAEAEQEHDALAARRAETDDRVRQLRDDLDRRTALRRGLADLEDPAAEAELRARLAEAEAASAAADRHAERLQAARAAEAAAAGAAQSAADQAARLEALLAERKAAADALAGAAAAVADLTAAAAEVRRRRDAATARQSAAAAAARTAAQVLSRVERSAAAVTDAALRQQLQAALDRGTARAAEIATAAEAARQGPDARTLSALENLWEALRVETRAAEAAAPRLTPRYAPGTTARIGWQGVPLEDGVAVPLPDGARLDLPGIGVLEIAPGGDDAAGRAARCRTELEAALAGAGCADIAAARAAAERRRDAERRLADLKRGFDADFPGGLAPLKARIAALPPAQAPESGLPDRAAAEAQSEAAARALAAADGHLAALRDQAATAAQAVATAEARRDAAQDRHDRAAASLAALTAHGAVPEAALAVCRDAIAERAAGLQAAEAARAALERDAPDRAQTATRLQRLRTALAETERQRLDLHGQLARLDGRIEAAAGDAPEEEAAAATARLDVAERRLRAIRHEVQVLLRLRSALDAARAQARDRYVAPVMAELRPLLSGLLPGSDLSLDPDAVLPDLLTRDGQPEPVGILSGGTREQIALLVRLAFARMLARGGQAAPVILDDAIVYTDDDRIERMFDALTRQAQDLQILVFSCRQRAFRGLGGRQLTLTEAVADADRRMPEAT